MDISSICLKAMIPLLIGLGLTGFAGVTTFGRERQKVRVKVKKRF